MKIACLGWGSLIWKPGNLPVASEWFTDGPRLPIEFSRVGDSGELATALCANAEPVPVLWAWLASPTVEAACSALKAREGIPPERDDGIGSLAIGGNPTGLISRWAQERGAQGVIWTGLPPRVNGVEGRIPTVDQAIAYLASLTGEVRQHARDYLEAVPAQIHTPYRQTIHELWLSIAN
ncbi:hypothetical protein G7027_20910 [Pseudomonas japonica]|nr:hypothetical protein [Pseudomonas japonica]